MTEEHGIATASQGDSWGVQEAAEASAEGWGLFDVDSTGQMQLQRDDVAELLESDMDAWKLVASGSTELHKKALAHLKANGPGEWLRITQGDSADTREIVVLSAGYQIRELGVGSGWIALKYGETEAKGSDESDRTYLGVFSSKAHLLEEVYAGVVAQIGEGQDDAAAKWEGMHIDGKIGRAWGLRGATVQQAG